MRTACTLMLVIFSIINLLKQFLFNQQPEYNPSKRDHLKISQYKRLINLKYL